MFCWQEKFLAALWHKKLYSLCLSEDLFAAALPPLWLIASQGKTGLGFISGAENGSTLFYTKVNFKLNCIIKLIPLQMVIELFSQNRHEWEGSWPLWLYQKDSRGWEKVLGESQGARGLGVMGISSHGCFSEGAKQDLTTWAHPIPRQVQGRGGSPRHWTLSWDFRDWCFWDWNEPQQELGRNIRPLDALQTETGWTSWKPDLVRYFHWKF